MRSRLMTTLALVLAVVAVACGGDDDDTTTSAGDGTGTTVAVGDDCAVENLELVTPGTLTVATGEPAFPPWVLNDDPSLGEGFEAGLVYAVAEQMGFTADQVVWIGTD
ncbi:MAG: amino acid ABC transporter substrate-binding protein, partial [Acidimicrobiia bacterium]